jgi:hypothetical protein
MLSTVALDIFLVHNNYLHMRRKYRTAGVHRRRKYRTGVGGGDGWIRIPYTC